MALISCKECGKEISEYRKSCPYCGCSNKPEKTGTEIAAGICTGLSFLINPLSILSVAGFILSIIALCDSNAKSKGYSTVCLILSIVTFIIFWNFLSLSLTIC